MECCVLVRRKEVKSGRIMNEENDWDHNVKGDAVEGLVVCVSREDVLQALNEMRSPLTFRRIIGVKKKKKKKTLFQ